MGGHAHFTSGISSIPLLHATFYNVKMKYSINIIAFYFVVLFTRNLYSVHRSPRTIGGTVCDMTNNSFVVSFRRPHSYRIFCVGSLITLRWALSAAHCFETSIISKLIGSPTATIGSPWSEGYDPGYAYYLQTRKVNIAYSHVEYDSYPNYQNDIAMVLMENEFELTPFSQRAKLPAPGDMEKCTHGRAMGWGREEVVVDSAQFKRSVETAERMPLKCVELPMISSDACESFYQHTIDKEKSICTMDEAGGKDVCGTDAGSPLMCIVKGSAKSPVDSTENNVTRTLRREREIVIGVFSRNRACGTKSPSIFIRVDPYVRWINDTMMHGTTAAFPSNKLSVNVILLLSFTFVIIS